MRAVHADKIVEEIREAWRQVLEDAGGDRASPGDYLRRRQAAEKREVVRRSSERIKQSSRRVSS